MGHSEAGITEYLARLSREFAVDGDFSESTNEIIKKDRATLAGKLSDIERNIVNRYAELGVNVSVMPLAAFFDYDDDGVAGNETLKEGEVLS